MSQRTGISLQLLMVIREACGHATPRPEDFLREDELAVIAAVELQVSKAFRSEVIERWLRVYAESLRRVAETETDWYRSEVVLPLLETGMSEGEMLEDQAKFGSQIAPLMERALVAVYHGQQERAWTQSAVEDLESVLEKAGLYEPAHLPPAVSFLDLSGYTRLTEEQGDEKAADLAEALRAMVRRSSRAHDGEAVKWLGDGVMFCFPEPGQAAMAALEMIDEAASHALPPARVGIHAGPVVFLEGDYFGRTVNVAARIADYARPGEVLVSREVASAASGLPISFTEMGPVELKGVVDPPTLYSAHRST